MKLNRKISNTMALLSVGLTVFFFTNCKKEKGGSKAPAITLSAESVAGQGQYTASAEYSTNGNPLSVDVNVTPASEVQSVSITKTLNLTTDATYGQNGVLTVDAAAMSSGKYTFTYSPRLADVNQLVGFKFTVTTKSGAKAESDLTLNVSFSPAANLPYKKWQLKSILHVNGKVPNEDVTLDCNKDNFFTFNTDGSCVLDNGALSCDMFEAFDTPMTWSLSADEKVFTLFRLNGFTGETKPQVYEVKELTLTSLKIQLTVDMSAFGGGVDDKFLYSYAATPK